MAMMPNYYYFVPKVKWTDEGAVVTLEDHSGTDVVEVVRCSDCVHFELFRRHDGFCKIDGMLRENDFFCKSGQRREDGDE